MRNEFSSASMPPNVADALDTDDIEPLMRLWWRSSNHAEVFHYGEGCFPFALAACSKAQLRTVGRSASAAVG